MLREIDKSSLALDKAVSEAVSDLREQNMETVSQSVLVFVTYTIGSLFLVTLSNMSLSCNKSSDHLHLVVHILQSPNQSPGCVGSNFV